MPTPSHADTLAAATALVTAALHGDKEAMERALAAVEHPHHVMSCLASWTAVEMRRLADRSGMRPAQLLSGVALQLAQQSGP